jgi:hypothetical protein
MFIFSPYYFYSWNTFVKYSNNGQSTIAELFSSTKLPLDGHNSYTYPVESEEVSSVPGNLVMSKEIGQTTAGHENTLHLITGRVFCYSRMFLHFLPSSAHSSEVTF